MNQYQIKAYCAGLFDASGWCGFTGEGKLTDLRVRISGYDANVLNGFFPLWQFSSTTWKEYIKACSTSISAYKFLVDIYPLAIKKKREIKAALNMIWHPEKNNPKEIVIRKSPRIEILNLYPHGYYIIGGTLLNEIMEELKAKKLPIKYKNVTIKTLKGKTTARIKNHERI
jgi:hypothetical protein